MKLKLIILLSILTYSKLLPVNLEISFGGGVGGSTEFSYTEGFNHIPSENGSRVDSDYFQIVKHFFIYIQISDCFILSAITNLKKQPHALA